MNKRISIVNTLEQLKKEVNDAKSYDIIIFDEGKTRCGMSTKAMSIFWYLSNKMVKDATRKNKRNKRSAKINHNKP